MQKWQNKGLNTDRTDRISSNEREKNPLKTSFKKTQTLNATWAQNLLVCDIGFLKMKRDPETFRKLQREKFSSRKCLLQRIYWNPAPKDPLHTHKIPLELGMLNGFHPLLHQETNSVFQYEKAKWLFSKSDLPDFQFFQCCSKLHLNIPASLVCSHFL